MGNGRMKARADRNRQLWPVLLLLLIAVVVPTAGLLWFMSQAMRNERLAVRQKLEDAYRAQLLSVQGRLDDYWNDKAAKLTDVDPDVRPTEMFARLVRANVADTVILRDATGRVRYPVFTHAAASTQPAATEAWLEAARLEYDQADPAAAAVAYAKIAKLAPDADIAARALQSQARCLANAGRTKQAREILTRMLADVRYQAAADTHGRLILPDAQLRAIQLMADPTRPEFRTTADLLRKRLNDYADPALPAAQRRFLMHELQVLVPDAEPFSTLAAEDLAANYIDADVASSKPGSLVPAPPLENIWQWTSLDRTVTAVFNGRRVLSDMQIRLADQPSLQGVTVRLLPPGEDAPPPEPFLTASAGESFPDWKLALYLNDTDPFAIAAHRQITAYVWTAILLILAAAGLALLVARYIGRQMKITKLKNDFVATVSHELKTPLASMRVLADMLLAGNVRDDRQAREYIQLIAKENARLSRLIDNFLTFSRMERNKAAFESAPLDVRDVVSEAVDVVREKFTSVGCRFEVDVADDLPTVTGDRDALVTVLLNLLENAYKYTEDDKRITLRAFATDGNLCLEVQDNGIGLSRRATKRIFDPFAQADRSLSRRVSGAGLGLSIVKFIVSAHKGSVAVTSRRGHGSTFTVKLPAGAGKTPRTTTNGR